MSFKLILAGACAFCVATPALASANPFASEKVRVATGDLDLTTSAGRERLNERISRAAVDVCGRSVNHHGPAMVRKASVCRAEVETQVREQVALRLQSAKVAAAD